MSRCQARAVVTGFYSAHGANGVWQEYGAASAPSLRGLFERPAGECRQSAALNFDRVAAGLLAELRVAALWIDDGLNLEPDRVAVSFAASKGRPVLLEAGTPCCTGLEWTCDYPAIALARAVRATGPVVSPVAACATGAHAIATGAQLIEDGYVDVALAGALEAEITLFLMAGYRQLGALSKAQIMRPFDRRRDGFVPGQGAACLILENAERAQRRGATIYGYVSGWAMQADATSMTGMSPQGDSIARAVEVAMKQAGYPSIDYINAHGTATPLNDAVETRGLRSAFGRSVPISATKPLTGHLLGAAGAVEAVLSLLAMRENYAPPTLNLEEPDGDCDLDYIPHRGRTTEINAVMSLSYGFGGHIGVLIFEKPQQHTEAQG
ncbi:MAG: beta-ketoacyl-[acyl-carrier-protein] synthase family protein [Armatimonadota bacterium]|nr:beta-ketoacyl-[acyl-carrier-protein] synthase family protein [Armatimonadota bacterium]